MLKKTYQLVRLIWCVSFVLRICLGQTNEITETDQLNQTDFADDQVQLREEVVFERAFRISAIVFASRPAAINS